MIVLAIGSVGAGGFLILGNRLLNFLGPVTGVPPTSHGIWTKYGVVTLVLVVDRRRHRLGAVRPARGPGHRARRATRSPWRPARTCTATPSTRAC